MKRPAIFARAAEREEPATIVLAGHQTIDEEYQTA
jgi:hypothetical protein